LLANLTVWGQNRDLCLKRLERALEDFTISGTPTNLPLLQRIVAAPEFMDGDYSTAFQVPLFDEPPAKRDDHLADLAVAAAVAYLHRTQMVHPQRSQRMHGGWHHSSRRLPQ
jgi:acetyl/propionyl-CoA carboxylase alpha subunit